MEKKSTWIIRLQGLQAVDKPKVFSDLPACVEVEVDFDLSCNVVEVG